MARRSRSYFLDGGINGRFPMIEEREFQSRLVSIRREYLRMTEGGRYTTHEERAGISRGLDFLDRIKSVSLGAICPKVPLNIWRLRQIWRSSTSPQPCLLFALANQPSDIYLYFRQILFPRLLVSYLHWYLVCHKK